MLYNTNMKFRRKNKNIGNPDYDDIIDDILFDEDDMDGEYYGEDDTKEASSSSHARYDDKKQQTADFFGDDLTDEELDRLVQRYVWDEERGVLCEVQQDDEEDEPSFKIKPLACFAVAVAAIGLLGWILSGSRLLPEECYKGESILSNTQAAQQQQTQQQINQDNTQINTEGDSEGTFVPASILIDGKAHFTLASTEAAYSLLEEVKNHYDAMVEGAGERTVEFMEETAILPAASATAEDIISYEDAFAALTSSSSPLRVKTTLTVVETEVIPFEEDTEKDDTLLEGTCIVVSQGREGSEITTTTNVYVNGDRSSTRSSKETTEIKAQDKLIRIGTEDIDLDEDSPGRHEGDDGKDQGELVFTSPTGDDQEVALNFGQVHGVLHLGLDYKNEDDEDTSSYNVLASCGGTVVCALERGGYGLMLEIDHGDGFVTRYACMESISVGLGDTVEAGQVIGTSPALHFELRIDGEAYNPRYYLD